MNLCTLPRTPEGKLVVYERATGHRLERFPVDARDMLASGDYTTDDPSGESGEPPAVPEAPAPEPVATQPHEHSPGVPLVVVKSEDAPPAQPVTIPTGSTSRGKKP